MPTPAAGSEPGGEERLREAADDVRYADGNGTSDYWRGFNDGIDKLVERLAATPPSSVAERGGLREVVARERGRLAGLPVPGSWHNRWGWEAAIREALRSLDAIDATTPVAATPDLRAALAWAAYIAYGPRYGFDRPADGSPMTPEDVRSALASEGGE